MPSNKRMVTKPDLKICTKCYEQLPYTPEFFGVNRSKKNTFGLLAQCKKCIADGVRDYNRNYQRDLRKQVLTEYGPGKLACVCCGDSHYEFLCLDHIKGGGGQERKTLSALNLLYKLRRLGFPKGEHRTLCCNCHQSYTEHGYCPHTSGN